MMQLTWPEPMLVVRTSPEPMPEVRRCRDEDLPAVEAFLRGLSRETRYRRFLSIGMGGPIWELRAVRSAGGPDRMALLAVAPPGHVVGLGRYQRDDPAGEAHLGLVVADAWQHRGVGDRLLRALVEEAARGGVARLHSDVLVENPFARHLRRLGAAPHGTPSLGVMGLDIDVAAWACRRRPGAAA